MPQRIALLALLLAVLPTVAIHLNYLIAASEGSVPWCIPYWQSCTSISATGRDGLAFYFFKTTMLPIAALYWLYWRAAQQTLIRHGYQGNAIFMLGSLAVLALVVYVLALGAVGDSFQLTRRIGIIFYFTFTYLCQLLIVWQLTRLAVADPSRNLQLVLLLLILVIGLTTVLLDLVMADYGAIEDAFEWVIALLLHGNFLLAAWGWRTAPVPVLLRTAS
ncbi:MAG: hypothetical protein ACE37N_16560 [Pseudohongiellaceae bacterium]